MIITEKIHPEAVVSNGTNAVKEAGTMEKGHNSSDQGSGASKAASVKFEQISKDGDTLELGGEKSISDAMLKGYSEAKLKQLYTSKEISKQQYDKAINSKIVIS